jgi:hypothetical protein
MIAVSVGLNGSRRATIAGQPVRTPPLLAIAALSIDRMILRLTAE